MRFQALALALFFSLSSLSLGVSPTALYDVDHGTTDLSGNGNTSPGSTWTSVTFTPRPLRGNSEAYFANGAGYFEIPASAFPTAIRTTGSAQVLALGPTGLDTIGCYFYNSTLPSGAFDFFVLGNTTLYFHVGGQTLTYALPTDIHAGHWYCYSAEWASNNANLVQIDMWDGSAQTIMSTAAAAYPVLASPSITFLGSGYGYYLANDVENAFGLYPGNLTYCAITTDAPPLWYLLSQGNSYTAGSPSNGYGATGVGWRQGWWREATSKGYNISPIGPVTWADVTGISMFSLGSDGVGGTFPADNLAAITPALSADFQNKSDALARAIALLVAPCANSACNGYGLPNTTTALVQLEAWGDSVAAWDSRIKFTMATDFIGNPARACNVDVVMPLFTTIEKTAWAYWKAKYPTQVLPLVDASGLTIACQTGDVHPTGAGYAQYGIFIADQMGDPNLTATATPTPVPTSARSLYLNRSFGLGF